MHDQRIVSHSYVENKSRGVAPGWRLASLLSAAVVAVLLCATLVFYIAFRSRGSADSPEDNRASSRNAPMKPNATTPQGTARNDDLAGVPAHLLPYPVTQDLRPTGKHVGGDEPVPPNSNLKLRHRFLRASEQVCTRLQPRYPYRILVSFDGQKMAYLNEQGLMLGPVGEPVLTVSDTATEFSPGAFSDALVPTKSGLYNLRGFRRRSHVNQSSSTRLGPYDSLATLTWSTDGNCLLWSDDQQQVKRLDCSQKSVQVLPAYGESPVPIPENNAKIILVRYRPMTKIDVPGTPVAEDQTEIVVSDWTNPDSPAIERVLVPASASRWHSLTLDPLGKRLALVSNRDFEGHKPTLWRVFILDLDRVSLTPLSLPTVWVESIAWSSDGQSLVYARTSEAQLIERSEDEERSFHHSALDLYLWDLTTGREKRLTHGGGFWSPSIARNGDLFYMANTIEQGSSPVLGLLRLPLQDALAAVAQESNPPVRSGALWTNLIQSVLREAGIPPHADGGQLTSFRLRRLAQTFRRLYKERFETDPPGRIVEFDQQRHELRNLRLPVEIQSQLALVVGVVEGEYLRRRYGAQWHLGKGPVVPSSRTKPFCEQGNLFACAVNPFRCLEEEPRRSLRTEGERKTRLPSLAEAIQSTQGRLIILANNIQDAQAAVESCTDTALSRGLKLLQQKNNTTAETMLLGLIGQHEKNFLLHLLIGQQLYEGKHERALQQWLNLPWIVGSTDPRVQNLRGAILLEKEPEQAILAFHTAIRCDLRYGSAYLNLAQAYERAQQPRSACLCLRRFLMLLPDDPYAADARHRLCLLSQ